MPSSTPHFGLDTSVLLRLLTGLPPDDYAKTKAALEELVTASPASELLVSNMVIGEAYVALQHHYGVGKARARQVIAGFLADSGVRPLNGAPVLTVLRKAGGAGLFDRLIAQDYAGRGITTLTNDRRMSQIEGVDLVV